jgi:aromatic-L-amino-acid decarboxylase
VADLDRLNQMLHRRLMRENRSMPSTTRVGGRLALRPCFVGARTTEVQARALVADVLRIGSKLVRELEPQVSQQVLPAHDSAALATTR